METMSVLFSWPMVLCAVGGIFTGFVDSIAGGGGLISLPMLLALGLPPHIAVGTNKFAAAFGNMTSAWQFVKAGKIDVHLLRYMAPFALAGSVCGSSVMIYLPPQVLEPLLLGVLILTAVFVFVKRDLGSTQAASSGRHAVRKACAAAFAAGIYDGFAGPGAGTFMVVAFAMLGFDLVVAAGNAKLLAIVTNITSLILIIYWQKIWYVYAVVLAVSLMIGAYFGSRMAIRRGTGFIRVIMLAVTVVLIAKLLINYVSLFS